MKKYAIFMMLLFLMSLNAGKPCPPNINCNFSLPKIKGMQIREIKIYAPWTHANWEDNMPHTIKWKWVSKSKNTKPIDWVAFYLINTNQNSSKKLFKKHAIMGYRPNKLYETKWFIDKNIYSFPGNFKLKVVLGDHIYGESGKFHISQSLHRETIRIKPKFIKNTYHEKFRHRHVNVTVDTTGLCTPSTKVPYNTMRVGYENRYKSSGVFEANYFHCSHAYRGYLIFDLHKIDSKNIKLLKAKLHMTRTSPTACATNGTVTNSCSCIREMDYFTQSKVNFNTPAEFYKKIGNNQAKLNIDVSSIVRKKKVSGAKRVGFRFIGINENYSENNNKCVSFYKNIYLELQVLKRGKLPPPPPPR